jgi:myo-inositol-1(or 4)-monophosphatase
MKDTMELIEARDRALEYMMETRSEVMQWFRGDFTVEEKADRSPVTQADRKVEEILRTRIGRDFPGHGIIGEEFGEENPDADWVWTIDPIDGTLSFIQGLPLFASLIALLHRGEPVMGVVALPALGETAWAVKGMGAHESGRRLKVSPVKSLSKAVVGTGDRYCFRRQKSLGLLKHLEREAGLVRTYPDAFGHLMAARGAIDLMVDPLAYVWDYAPLKVLIEEAGGTFQNFTGRKASLSEGTALTGNRELVRAVRKLCAAPGGRR